MPRQDVERAERRLLSARRPSPAPLLPPGWRQRVMAEVTALAARGPAAAWVESRRRAWAAVSFRVAGAGALCAAVLAVLAQVYGPDLEGPLARLLTDFPGLSHLLGASIWS